MRSLIQRCALILGAIVGLLGSRPATANAQKALVYCPVTIDATGCNAIVTALTGPAYPLGVDRGYDGTAGTVDLETVDLFAYSVFVVPSLADGASSQPYAKLRDPEVVEHLKAALIGRIAMWSGTPDQGATNRGMKDALIQNLAGYAGGAFGTAKGPGLVALLDMSSNTSSRYDWVRAITPVPVTSDAALLIYNSVRALNPRATSILTSGSGPIVYDNMATFGFQVPNGAPGVMLDVLGQTGTTQGGQVVLLTMEGGNAGGATVQTDKDDYAPGTTVVITGSGWQPGETVKLTLHHDPLRDNDTELSAVADGDGKFSNTSFAPADYDVDVRFVLTAIGQGSGQRAQATFTDAQPNKVTLAGQSPSPVSAGGTATYAVTITFNGNNNSCTATLTGTPAPGPAWPAPPPGGFFSFSPPTVSSSGADQTSTLTVTTPAGMAPNGAYKFTVTAAGSGGDCNGNATATSDPTNLNVAGPANVATTLTLAAPSPASVTYRSSALVALSATLTRTTGGAAVVGASVAFTVDGTPVGNATTNATGVASLNYDPSLLNVATHTVQASSATQVIGGTTYLLSSSSTQSLLVTAATVTPNVTVSDKTYDGTTAATIATRALTGVFGADAVSLVGGTATFNTKNVGTGKTVTVTGLALSGAAAANYVLSSTIATTTANISAATVSVLITAANKVYDGNTTATLVNRTPSGVIGAEVVTVSGGTATFDTKGVGTAKTVTASGFTLGGADAGNYLVSATPATCTADITALAITGNFTAASKPYDGNATAAVLTRTLNSVIALDLVSLTGGSATFDSKNVGTGKTVTLTGATLSGADAANYSLTSVGTTTADITALSITGNFTASNKVYDGTTAATVLTRTLSGAIGADVVSLTGGIATFADKNVGTGKTVTLTGASLTGGDAGNYTLTTVATATADITALGLIGSFTAGNKIYDGNTSAVVLSRSASGALGTDDVSLIGGIATFGDRNVGTGKTVTLGGASLSGAAAGNYTLASVSTTTADITALSITGSFTASNKVYDGTTAATVLTRTLSGAIAGDAVSLTGGTATFANKNVGTAKTVTLATASVTGADAGNYTLASVSTTTADITARTLTVSATGVNKIYDGTTTATVTLSDDRVAGDGLTTTYSSAAFADKNVGNGKTITVSGISIGGVDAANYTLAATPVTATANITALAITGSITANDKVYDGTTSATIASRTLVGQIMGDVVSYIGGTATFATKTAANGKTVTATGLSLDGADAGNYTVNATATTTASITPLGITGNFTASNKVYDGNQTAAIVTQTLNGVIAPDVVSQSGGTATFDTRNVGTGKTVTLTGAGLTGADAGNYTLSSVGTTMADITPLAITGSITASNKTYDGNTSATIASRAFTGVLGTDAVSYTGGTATFADKNVGTAKVVTATGLGLTGADAGNYTVNASATATADIMALALASSITAANKVYDATVAASITNRSLTGVIAPDVASLTGGTATFDTKNVGTGKAVTASGLTLSGADAGNYSVTGTAVTTANITPFGITGSITANDKVYDGTAAATIASRTLAGVFSGDVVSYTGGTATFDTKNVGTGKTVSATGLGLSGGDAGNYTVNTTATATAKITPATPTIVWANPADIIWPAALTAVQLNATVAGVLSEVPAGSFAYTPASGTVLTPVSAYPLAVQFTSSDPNYFNASKTVSINVLDKSKPIVSNSAVNPNPVALGTTTVALTSTISNAATGGSKIVTACYRVDGGTCNPVNGFTPNVTVTVTAPVSIPNTTDVLEVCVYGTDAAGNTNEKLDCVLVAVYDPNGGFVTGGGWINSPTGAYAASPLLSGKATFGFVSKYKKGQSLPDGNTEFQFQAAGFNFKSTSYEWLVVAGSKAQYKGSGTINGSGDYFFMLTATDGDGKGNPDTFRMKVWNKTTLAVIYDNQIGLLDTADPLMTLGGGSIQIHDK